LEWSSWAICEEENTESIKPKSTQYVASLRTFGIGLICLFCRCTGERKNCAAHPQAIRESAPIDARNGVVGVLKARDDLIVRYFIRNDHLDSKSISQSSLPATTLQNHTTGLRTIKQQVARWMLYWLLDKAPIDNPSREILLHLECALAAPKALYQLPADHLLTLVQYNVLRAFVSNALCLGLDPDRICSGLSSPFTSSDPETPRLLPPALYPTSLQRRRSHHPFIDIFPSAAVRNNVLSATEYSFDENEMWREIFGTQFLKGNVGVTENMGMVVWGEPWRVESWEITEGCWRKWRWMFTGCRELLEATNFWRKERGEAALEVTI
jgi:hypothetical protein